MTDKKSTRPQVPPRWWEWQTDTGICGVHTHEGQLVWWSCPSGPTGHLAEAAREQSFDDFLTSGPAVPAPSHVVEEVRALLESTYRTAVNCAATCATDSQCEKDNGTH